MSASPENPSGATSGSLLWVQLVTSFKIITREEGPQSSTGIVECAPEIFDTYPPPLLDTRFPAETGAIFKDPPFGQLKPAYINAVVSEERYENSFLTYVMWNPNLSRAIPVPLGSLDWQWTCDAANTLTDQGNETNWARLCGEPRSGRHVEFHPGSSYPIWQNVISTGVVRLSCHNILLP